MINYSWMSTGIRSAHLCENGHVQCGIWWWRGCEKVKLETEGQQRESEMRRCATLVTCAAIVCSTNKRLLCWNACMRACTWPFTISKIPVRWTLVHFKSISIGILETFQSICTAWPVYMWIWQKVEHGVKFTWTSGMWCDVGELRKRTKICMNLIDLICVSNAVHRCIRIIHFACYPEFMRIFAILQISLSKTDHVTSTIIAFAHLIKKKCKRKREVMFTYSYFGIHFLNDRSSKV